MSDYTKYLTSQVALGKMSRREFIGRAAAFGVTLAVAGTMFDSAAEAQEPKRGGNLKLGLEGAATTDSKDPAKAISQFMLVVGRNWGDTVVKSDPLTGKAVPALAKSWEPSADASTWTFTIRRGVNFHDGKVLTADDVVKTLLRHSDAKSEIGCSWDAQILQGGQIRR